MAKDAKTGISDESRPFMSDRLPQSLCHNGTKERIGAGSYRADKGKQLVFPFPLFQLRHLNNCNMRKRKPKEEWADVPGYEGLYRVSSFGRVIADPRTREYTDKDGNVKVRYYERRFIEPKQDRNEYKHVMLCDRNENKKVWSIHRLVALAFIPNPYNLPIVNHKDENKSNNRADNLEWCTNEYNLAYGTAAQRHGAALSARLRAEAVAEDEARMASYIRRRGQIIVFKVADGATVGRFNSIEEARQTIGIKHLNRKYVEECLNGKRESAHGYEWLYDKWRVSGKYMSFGI